MKSFALQLTLIYLLYCIGASNAQQATQFNLSCPAKHHIIGWDILLFSATSNVVSLRLNCSNGLEDIINPIALIFDEPTIKGVKASDITLPASYSVVSCPGSASNFSISQVKGSFQKLCNATLFPVIGSTGVGRSQYACTNSSKLISSLSAAYQPASSYLNLTTVVVGCSEPAPKFSLISSQSINFSNSNPSFVNQFQGGLFLPVTNVLTVQARRDEDPLVTLTNLDQLGPMFRDFCLRNTIGAQGPWLCADTNAVFPLSTFQTLKLGVSPGNILRWYRPVFQISFNLSISSPYAADDANFPNLASGNISTTIFINFNSTGMTLFPLLGLQFGTFALTTCPNGAFMTNVSAEIGPFYVRDVGFYCTDGSGPFTISGRASLNPLNTISNFVKCPFPSALNLFSDYLGTNHAAPLVIGASCINPDLQYYKTNFYLTWSGSSPLSSALAFVCPNGEIPDGFTSFVENEVLTSATISCKFIDLKVTFVDILGLNLTGIGAGNVSVSLQNMMNYTFAYGIDSQYGIALSSVSPSVLSTNDFALNVNASTKVYNLTLPTLFDVKNAGSIVMINASSIISRLNSISGGAGASTTISLTFTVTSGFGHKSAFTWNLKGVQIASTTTSSISSSTTTTTTTTTRSTTTSSTVSNIFTNSSSLFTTSSSTTSSISSTSSTFSGSSLTTLTTSFANNLLTGTQQTVSSSSPSSTTAGTDSFFSFTTLNTVVPISQSTTSDTSTPSTTFTTFSATFTSSYSTTSTTTTTTTTSAVDSSSNTFLIVSVSVGSGLLVGISSILFYILYARRRKARQRQQRVNNAIFQANNRSTSKLNLIDASLNSSNGQVQPLPSPSLAAASTIQSGYTTSNSYLATNVQNGVNSSFMAAKGNNTGMRSDFSLSQQPPPTAPKSHFSNYKQPGSFAMQAISRAATSNNNNEDLHQTNTIHANTITLLGSGTPLAIPGYLHLSLQNDFRGFNFDDKDVIGKGRSAVIYRARVSNPELANKWNTQKVAIKLITDRSLDSMFLFEVALLGSLPPHPNILTFFGYFDELDPVTSEPMRGMVLKLYNSSLSAILFHSKLVLIPEQMAFIALRVARAMQFLHDHDIVHFDLKPLNILVDRINDQEINVVVNDFGCARPVGSDLSGTKSRMVAGLSIPSQMGLTVGYSSPELLLQFQTSLQSCNSSHKKVDVYAFGITLFEIITQKRAWSSLNSSALGVTPPQSNHGTASTAPDSAPQKSNLTTANLMRAILEGQRPSFSASQLKSEDVWLKGLIELAQACWNPLQERRPSFKDILRRIEGLGSSQDYLDTTIISIVEQK